MKTLILFKSIHLGGAKKLAYAIGEELSSEVVDAGEITKINLDDFDLIGIGSGIYDGGFHKNLYKMVDESREFTQKKVFLFSSSGVIYDKSHTEIRKKLLAKNCEIVGEFYSKGHNKNSFLKYFGGMNKGRPDYNDLERARRFAKTLIKKF